MKKYGPQLFTSLLFVTAAIALACGSGSRGQLKSVSVSPAAANSEDYPDGQVQFTALGYYGTSSSGVPTPVTWSACSKTGPAVGITVSSSGVGQCKAGASGTYYVNAFVQVPSGVQCDLRLACFESGSVCGGVQGAATLTCP
jgi:hypothetical protein